MPWFRLQTAFKMQPSLKRTIIPHTPQGSGGLISSGRGFAVAQPTERRLHAIPVAVRMWIAAQFLRVSAGCQSLYKPFQYDRISTVGKKKPRLVGGKTSRGWGYVRGGPKEDRSLVRHRPCLRRKHTNLLQFFVSKKPLFFVPGALHVSNARFVRDSTNLFHPQAQQVSRTRLRHVFRDLIAHHFSLRPEPSPVRLLPRLESSSYKCRHPNLRRSSSALCRCSLSAACPATEPGCLPTRLSEPPPVPATPRTLSACVLPQD